MSETKSLGQVAWEAEVAHFTAGDRPGLRGAAPWSALGSKTQAKYEAIAKGVEKEVVARLAATKGQE